MTRTSAGGEHPRALVPKAPVAAPRIRGERARLPSAALNRQRAAPKAIGLFGLFASGNSGNDGSLEAMLLFLRRVRPDAEIICISPSAEAAGKAFGVRACGTGRGAFASPLARTLDRLLLGLPRLAAGWAFTIGQVRNLDLLIFPGTGILDDFGTGPMGLPYTLFRWCCCARLCGTGIWFVSIGAGPIHHPVSRRLMRSAAAMAEYRSYRDVVSKEFMRDIGFDAGRDPIYPDLVFNLPAPRPTDRHCDSRALTVGVGVMAYDGWRGGGAAIYQAYLAKMTRFVLWLLDCGYRVRLLTGDAVDRRAVDDLATILAASIRSGAPPLLAEPTHSLHDLMRQIAGTDLVVATRFHNVVCALKLGKPAISIGYSRKNDALLAEMGLHGFCQDIERLDVDLLIEQFTTLMAERAAHGLSIGGRLSLYERQLADQDAVLSSKLRSRH